MARTIAEIDADITRLKASGLDGRSAGMRELRDERAAVIATLPAEPVHSVTLPARVSVDAEVEDLPFVTAPEPKMPSSEADEERAFVQKVISDYVVVPGTSVVKNMYQNVKYKVRVWRIMRGVLARALAGADLPEWAELGLDSYTGEKAVEKPKPPLVTTPVAAERQIPPPAQVPAFAPSSGAPSELDMLKAAVRNMTERSISEKPQARPETVAV